MACCSLADRSIRKAGCWQRLDPAARLRSLACSSENGPVSSARRNVKARFAGSRRFAPACGTFWSFSELFWSFSKPFWGLRNFLSACGRFCKPAVIFHQSAAIFHTSCEISYNTERLVRSMGPVYTILPTKLTASGSIRRRLYDFSYNMTFTRAQPELFVCLIIQTDALVGNLRPEAFARVLCPEPSLGSLRPCALAEAFP